MGCWCTGSRRVARQYFAAANLLICAAFVAGAFFVDGAGPAVMIITAGSFFAALGGVSAYAITIDMGGEHVGTVFSLMNMCGNIGASVCPICIAWIVERTGHWDPVLFVFAAIYVAAAVSWLLLNPNGTGLDRNDGARRRCLTGPGRGSSIKPLTSVCSLALRANVVSQKLLGSRYNDDCV